MFEAATNIVRVPAVPQPGNDVLPERMVSLKLLSLVAGEMPSQVRFVLCDEWLVVTRFSVLRYWATSIPL